MSNNYAQSQTNRKLQDFRVSIRKKELSEYFQERRREFFMREQDQEASDLVDELKNNREKQTQFLMKCSRQLTGESSQQWQHTIKKLMNASMAFEGEFSEWVQLSIIKNLVLALKDTYFPIRIGPKICEIFSDLVYLSSQKQNEFGSKIMEYEPLQYIIRHGMDTRYTLFERVKCLQLCANLSHENYHYRNIMYKMHLGKWILELAKEFYENHIHQKLAQFLQAIKCIISLHPKDKIDATRVNLFLQLMSFTFEFYTDNSTSGKIVLKCMEVLSEILKNNKQIFYSTLYTNIPAFRRTMVLLIDQDPTIRIKSMFLLSLLSYNDNVDISLQFLDAGFFNNAYYAYNNLKGNENAAYSRTLTLTLANICCSSQRVAQNILGHPIFECVINQLSHPQMKNKKQGFQCLNTIINTIKTISFEILIEKYNILHYLTLGLTELRFVDAQTMIEIITTLINLIEKSENIYNKAGNLVVNKLQNSYCITRILQEILNKTNHELLRNNANQLHQMISEILWSYNDAI